MAKDLYLQAVRGIAIVAVVLIHCLPQEAASVALRPFLNFAVAVFIFLSGYLTPREKTANAASFLRRRVGKIAAPYIVWTILYLGAGRTFSPTSVLYAFVVGGGSWQMYYLVVYLQLVLLTPWLFRMLDHTAVRAALYAVTPVTLVIRYALLVGRLSLPIQAFCGSWLIFYLLGLEWRDRIAPWMRRRSIGSKHALVTLLACLALQEIESFAWFSLGNYSFATTQLKATNLLCSLCVCALVPLASKAAKSRLSYNRVLVFLGDISFGVFLVHMAFYFAFARIFELIGIVGFPQSLLLWVMVLSASSVLVALCQRIFPKRLLSIVGFAQRN